MQSSTTLTRADLRKNQLEAVAFIKRVKKCALWAQMGLGKCGAVLTALVDLFNTVDVARVLVVAPKDVARKTWPDELRRWAHARQLSFEVLWGCDQGFTLWNESAEKRLRFWASKVWKAHAELQDAYRNDDFTADSLGNIKLLERQLQRALRIYCWGLCAARRPADIQIINWQNLQWLVYFWGRHWPYDTIVYDESSIGLKNGKKAVVWRAMRMVAGLTERIIELTGTPTPKGLINLWGQIHLLDDGQRLGRNITAYRRQYFDADYNGFEYEPREGAMEAVMERISDIVLVQRSKDYLDLPPTIFNNIPVILDDDQMRAYKKMAKTFVTQVAGELIEAVNKGVLSNKLLQLANGRVYDADRKVRVLHEGKLEAMENYIEEQAGENVLCVYWYKHDLEAIMKRFKRAVVYRKGQLSIQDDWNRGKIRLLLLHPDSGGHGLNIQYGGRRILWYGPIWNQELYDQVNSRLAGARAVGQGTTFIDHLITHKTIDERALAVCQGRGDAQELMMSYLKTLLGT